jgi:hypothetical protein
MSSATSFSGLVGGVDIFADRILSFFTLEEILRDLTLICKQDLRSIYQYALPGASFKTLSFKAPRFKHQKGMLQTLRASGLITLIQHLPQLEVVDFTGAVPHHCLYSFSFNLKKYKEESEDGARVRPGMVYLEEGREGMSILPRRLASSDSMQLLTFLERPMLAAPRTAERWRIYNQLVDPPFVTPAVCKALSDFCAHLKSVKSLTDAGLIGTPIESLPADQSVPSALLELQFNLD